MEMAALQTITDEDEYRVQTGAIEEYYQEGFVPTFRYSFLVSLHMVVETSLREFCNSVKRDRSLPLGPSDLRGKNLEPCRIFLTKVVGLKLDDFQ